MSEYLSWGRFPHTLQNGLALPNRYSTLPDTVSASEASYLPYGLGRSYGDSCRNHQGVVVSSANLNSFIAFDADSGVLRCEAGVTLADILAMSVRQGWFLHATPGTKYVTVAGAIANDVHGKNHHTAGSFGNHLRCFELLRSDGSRLLCSESENSELFYATIGGLGVTGFITWAEIQLKPIKGPLIATENIKYNHLSDFFSISEESVASHEYTVAWVDCSATGAQLGRGHFTRGNHAEGVPRSVAVPARDKGKLSFPVTPPISLVSNLSVRAFNELYYHRQRQLQLRSDIDYDPFFYPLDGILNWNRMYGKQGFLQHQCIIPKDNAEAAIKEMIARISASGMGSFLVVLKMMGDISSKGLISFPAEGATLALDFPYKGEKTLAFLQTLDAVVAGAGGRIYPAKDARMSAEIFQQSYPAWKQLEQLRDPAIHSDFWSRVTGVY